MLKSVIRRRSVLVTLLMIPAVLAGCGIGDPLGHDRTIVGTYTLEQFNGVDVPGTIYEDASTKLEILSGALVLESDNRYREPIGVRRTIKRDAQVIVDSQEDNGMYTVNGNAITFMSSDPKVGNYTGTWNVNKITYISGGVYVTFLRR